jgi:hypothetical protein
MSAVGNVDALTIILATIGSLATITASIVGALLGGKYVKSGVMLAAKKSREAENIKERQQIENLRKALLVEIESLVERYMDGVGNQLEAAPNNAPFLWIYPTHQRYFIIYEENAHLIGQIPDDKERELIVKAYNLAKGLLDCLKLNSAMVERHDYAVGLGPVILGSNSMHVQNSIIENMTEYTPVLKGMHNMTIMAYKELKSSLQMPIIWDN